MLPYFQHQNQPEKEENELKPEVSIGNQAEHVRSPFEDETAEEVRSVLKREQKNNSPQPVPRALPDEKPPLTFRYVFSCGFAYRARRLINKLKKPMSFENRFNQCCPSQKTGTNLEKRCLKPAFQTKTSTSKTLVT